MTPITGTVFVKLFQKSTPGDSRNRDDEMRISAHHLPRNCAITLLAPLAGVTLHNQILALDIAEPGAAL